MSKKPAFEIKNSLIGPLSDEQNEQLRKRLAEIFTPEWEARQVKLQKLLQLRKE